MKQSPISENHQFDPEHEFDLCLVFEKDGVLTMLPVEVKAGLLAPKIRQTKTALFALGNMLAILDGQTRVLDLKEMKVRYEGNHVQLGHHWGLIARRSVLETLRRNGKLTSKPFVLALEDIFNLVPDEQLAKIVNRIIVREDYKTEWHLH